MELKKQIGRVISWLHLLGGMSKDESEIIKKLDPARPEQRSALIKALGALIDKLKDMNDTVIKRRLNVHAPIIRFIGFFTRKKREDKGEGILRIILEKLKSHKT